MDKVARGTDTQAQPAALHSRQEIATAARIVVKVGSSSLTSVAGGISEEALEKLVDVLAQRRLAGTEIILVSSGAISAGLLPLGLSRRPKDLATQQAAASVGQGLLMAHYNQAFTSHGVTASQVLLTAEDLTRRHQYVNAHRALERLLNLGVVPIVNENDTVATHEIRFGDNDRLAALVAHLVKADALVLLSDVDSLYDGPPSEGATRISHVDSPEDLEGIVIGSAGKAGVGTGGMATKVQAAMIAAETGIPALVTSTAKPPPRWRGRTWEPGSASTATSAPCACCGWPTWPTSAAAWSSTTAPCGPSANGTNRCCRLESRRHAATLTQATPWRSATPRAMCLPMAWLTTATPTCPRCWAAPPRTWPRTWAGSLNARGCPCGRPGPAQRPAQRLSCAVP